MAVVTMRQLLEAGIHFGHQTRRWHPKMKRYIHGQRNGIYIIDLQQTLRQIYKSYGLVRDTVAKGGTVLFVGAWVFSPTQGLLRRWFKSRSTGLEQRLQPESLN